MLEENVHQISARGLHFPINVTNSNGEAIEITRSQGSRGYLYLFETKNKGYFSYSTSSFAELLKYAHLSFSEVYQSQWNHTK